MSGFMPLLRLLVMLIGLMAWRPATAWYAWPGYNAPYGYGNGGMWRHYGPWRQTMPWFPGPYRGAAMPEWQVYGEMDAFGNYVFYVRYRGSVYTMVNRRP